MVEDDIPFIDDMPLDEEVVAAGAADPLVFDELVLGLVVVAPQVLEDELAGLAVVDDVLVLAALWQPASAKRTADARINFFIMISGTLGGLTEHTLQPLIISNVEAAGCKRFFSRAPGVGKSPGFGPGRPDERLSRAYAR